MKLLQPPRVPEVSVIQTPSEKGTCPWRCHKQSGVLEIMKERANENRDFLAHICFSDESTTMNLILGILIFGQQKMSVSEFLPNAVPPKDGAEYLKIIL
ncbi:hypothetical protein QE152_g11192 [Popillia japonica]|uniref:Uncharacterized protein n=1 Tax=Popillia japonica TaxID=7064 RepID=A0AAW1LSS2_POPJA